MTSTAQNQCQEDPVSVSPLSFWVATAAETEESFRVLRDERPVSWHPPLEGSLTPLQQHGLWAVVRNEAIGRVSKHPTTFSSAQGVMQKEILDAAQSFLSWAADEVANGGELGPVLHDSLLTLLGIGMDWAEYWRANPGGDDLMTILVQAEVGGQRLDDEEIGAFFVLLSVIGDDTTRNAISLIVKALTDFPDQRRILAADFERCIGTAVEDFVRWGTSVRTFRRTLLKDVEVHGQKMSACE